MNKNQAEKLKKGDPLIMSGTKEQYEFIKLTHDYYLHVKQGTETRGHYMFVKPADMELKTPSPAAQVSYVPSVNEMFHHMPTGAKYYYKEPADKVFVLPDRPNVNIYGHSRYYWQCVREGSSILEHVKISELRFTNNGALSIIPMAELKDWNFESATVIKGTGIGGNLQFMGPTHSMSSAKRRFGTGSGEFVVKPAEKTLKQLEEAYKAARLALYHFHMDAAEGLIGDVK